MFGWFDKKPTAKLWPEARWTVSVDESGFRSVDHTGDTRSVSFTDLSRVIIETNDSGPVGADIWWLLFGPDGNLACAFPQGATGDEPVVDRLMKLPGFDFEQMIDARPRQTTRPFRFGGAPTPELTSGSGGTIPSRSELL